PDLAVASTEKNEVYVLLTDRDLFLTGDCTAATAKRGTFKVASQPLGIATGDISRNNTLDIAVAMPIGVSILTGDGLGGFAVGDLMSAGVSPGVVALADVDGDGFVDGAVGNGTGDRGRGAVTVLYGMAGGKFEPPVSTAVPGLVAAFVVQDLNKDGFVDFAVV